MIEVLNYIIKKGYQVFLKITLKLLCFIQLYQFVYDIELTMFQFLCEVVHPHYTSLVAQRIFRRLWLHRTYMNHLQPEDLHLLGHK